LYKIVAKILFSAKYFVFLAEYKISIPLVLVSSFDAVLICREISKSAFCEFANSTLFLKSTIFCFSLVRIICSLSFVFRSFIFFAIDKTMSSSWLSSVAIAPVGFPARRHAFYAEWTIKYIVINIGQKYMVRFSMKIQAISFS